MDTTTCTSKRFYFAHDIILNFTWVLVKCIEVYRSLSERLYFSLSLSASGFQEFDGFYIHRVVSIYVNLK